MKNTLNWKKSIYKAIEEPLFESYGSFVEKRPILVDCSLGINPVEDLYPSDPICIDMTPYRQYPAGGVHGNPNLASYICKRWPTVEPETICFGAGSHSTICSLSRILGGSKVHILGTLPQFIPGLIEFSVAGCTMHSIPLTAPYGLDVRKLAEQIPTHTTLVYIDNPNNPTGRVLPLEDIAWLAKACAVKGALLFVDEAYGDFIEDSASALNLTDTNIICARSFSKGCGLAGIRTGYIVIRDSELRHHYYELGLHFSSSALAGDVAAKLLPKLDLPKMRQKAGALKKQVTELIGTYSQFTIAPTHPNVPIFLLSMQDTQVNLYDELMGIGIRTEPAKFFGLDSINSVRLRSPSSTTIHLFCELWKKHFK